MIDEVQPGDIVKLKSGGRHMTAGREGFNNTSVLTCYWFEVGELRESEVPKVALEKVTMRDSLGR